MIFNSPEFLFAFLPVLGIALFILYKLRADSLLLPLLLGASFVFYLFSGTLFTLILILSVLVNFYVGKKIGNAGSRRSGSRWLTAGIVFNVGYICLFKYTEILSADLLALLNNGDHNVALPLGVSFYSFTQMGYLFDQYDGATPEKKLINYSLFVGLFPAVSSGPIVQHDDVGRQLNQLSFQKFNIEKITRGFCLLLIGMFKKVILADYAATLSNEAYRAIANGVAINSFEAWIGAISYSLQLYFDFSGYSDIAVGLGWMIGINFPWNFNSPYKAENIVDFWRRWHISLSTWLNNYVFEPINYAVTKKVKTIAVLDKSNIGLWGYLTGTFVTMFLCGLWHGATLNFVLWGLLHVALIFSNRFWNMFKAATGRQHITNNYSTIHSWTNRLITFVCVTFAWVLFRSVDLNSTLQMWRAMVGMNGVFVPPAVASKLGLTLDNNDGLLMFTSTYHSIFSIPVSGILVNLGLLLIIIFLLPNSREIMNNQCRPVNGYLKRIAKFLTLENGWKPSIVWLLIMSVMTISLVTWNKMAEFLYFNF
jgi:D-alanyl-lipoteichoic acid acyltransferase DltB (MBOAT superfamily)